MNSVEERGSNLREWRVEWRTKEVIVNFGSLFIPEELDLNVLFVSFSAKMSIASGLIRNSKLE